MEVSRALFAPAKKKGGERKKRKECVFTFPLFLLLV